MLYNMKEVSLRAHVHAKSLHPYPTLCDPMDYSLPGSSVHEISKARILEQVAISFSRESFPLRDSASVSCDSQIGRWILYH